MKNSKHRYGMLLFVILLMMVVSCEEFVRVDLPNSQISSKTVFDNDNTAIAAATGMYDAMLQRGNFIGQSFNPISYLGGMLSDEIVDYTGLAPYSEFYNNELSVNNTAVLNVWSSGYKVIYEANAVIEGVSSSDRLSEEVKRRLTAEAKFIRAFYLLYLVNLFGDIPIITATDYRVNAIAGRQSAAEVYAQLKSDLKDARDQLSVDYSGPARVRPNRWSASALLARAYLYERDYKNAELEATTVIESSMYELVSDPNDVFLANSKEAILQLSQVFPNGFPTADAQNLIIVITPFSSSVSKSLSVDLLNAFEEGDARAANWTKAYVHPSGTVFHYAYKYKVRGYSADANYPEHLVLLRLAEQYLIRAEARMEQGDLDGAKKDLNTIRSRAGLPESDANSQESLRMAIQRERRIELFCEMGHRWFDLKRSEQAGQVLEIVKPFWSTTDVYLPIPEQEMLNNPYLKPQNDGY